MSRKPQDRRTFIKTVAGGAVALGSSLAGWPGGRSEEAPARVVRDGMAYRRLGRTGLLISEISLGSSPLPDPDLLRAIIDRGVNYIDTSHSYENGNAERRIGQLVRDVGKDKLHFSTKFHVAPRDTPASIIASVRGSLRRLGVETIDVLMIHGAESAAVVVDERVLEAFEKLKADGAYRFKGLSCHANQDEVVRKAVDCGLYDAVQVGYNVFDIQGEGGVVETYPDYLGTSGLRALIGHAHAHGVGVVAMKTLKVGGRRQDLAKYRTGSVSLHQAMLRWVLDDERITSAVIEILNRTEMEEDLGAAGTKLAAAERATLVRYVRENGTDYCHGCARCRKVCPAGLDTTGILRALAYSEAYGKTGRARAVYASLGGAEQAPACRDCGACEQACPYGVAVRSGVRRAGLVLALPGLFASRE